MTQRPAPGTSTTSLHELSALLVREREVLELIVERVADAGGAREREILLRSITSLELHRAIAARAVAVELGMDREPTLRELAARAPREWTGPLRDHLRALTSLAEEISSVLRPAPAALRREGNVISLPERGPALHRSLVEFLA